MISHKTEAARLFKGVDLGIKERKTGVGSGKNVLKYSFSGGCRSFCYRGEEK